MIRAQKNSGPPDPGAAPDWPPLIIEEVTDPEEIARFRLQDERYRRNRDWLQSHWPELLPQARGKFVAVAGQEAFIADSSEQARALAKAAHPEDDGVLDQYVRPTPAIAPSQPNIVIEEVHDPELAARFRLQDERYRRNRDWLRSRWPDLLAKAPGKFVAVAGQQAFITDTAEQAWAAAEAAHPEDDGVLVQYLHPERGPRVYVHLG